MLGAIIGDIVGSRFEWNNHKTKDFEFFAEQCCFTDDSVMTIAICKSILQCKGDFADLDKQTTDCMQAFGRKYRFAGYGGRFRRWLISENPQPYNSFGNGSAMRVSAIGWIANDIEQAKELSAAVTGITHNHPEGLKGAESVAVAIVLARQGKSKKEIRDFICENYYDIDFTLNDIRADYVFDVTCQGSVPQAFEAFFESTDFEDTIRNAISIGGDSDTIAAIAGGIAEAYYGIGEDMRNKAFTYLDEQLTDVVTEFEKQYSCKIL